MEQNSDFEMEARLTKEGVVQATRELRETLFNVLNGMEPPETLLPPLAWWRRTIQPLNNENVGLLLEVGPLLLGAYKITGNPKLDLGQKNERGSDADREPKLYAEVSKLWIVDQILREKNE